MTALIAKAQTATTDQLLEMAMLLIDASTVEGMMSRTAVSVALEERLSPEEFERFFLSLDGEVAS